MYCMLLHKWTEILLFSLIIVRNGVFIVFLRSISQFNQLDTSALNNCILTVCQLCTSIFCPTVHLYISLKQTYPYTDDGSFVKFNCATCAFKNSTKSVFNMFYWLYTHCHQLHYSNILCVQGIRIIPTVLYIIVRGD